MPGCMTVICRHLGDMYKEMSIFNYTLQQWADLVSSDLRWI